MNTCDNPINSLLCSMGVLAKAVPLDKNMCNELRKQLECTYGENYLELSDSLCDIRELKQGVACLMKDRDADQQAMVVKQRPTKEQSLVQEISQAYKAIEKRKLSDKPSVAKNSGEAMKKTSANAVKSSKEKEDGEYVAVGSSVGCKIEGPKPCKQIWIQNTSDTKVMADYGDENEEKKASNDIKLNFDIILETEPQTKIKQIFANVNYDDHNYNYKADLVEQPQAKEENITEQVKEFKENFEKTTTSSSEKTAQQQQPQACAQSTIHGESVTDIISKKSSARGTITKIPVTEATAADAVLLAPENTSGEINAALPSSKSSKDSAKDSANDDSLLDQLSSQKNSNESNRQQSLSENKEDDEENKEPLSENVVNREQEEEEDNDEDKDAKKKE